MIEVYSLDPDFRMDEQQFSPKVISLANEAKTEQRNARCKAALEEARENLAVGDAKALLGLLQSMKPMCAVLGVVEPEAVELVFKKGLSDYRQGHLSNALQSFRAALSIAPTHEMAAEYLELTENKLQLAGDRALVEWQKNFQTRQFKEAAAVYRRTAALDDAGSMATLNRISMEYRQSLEPLAESWNAACSSGDEEKIGEIRDEVAELLPEPAFGADIRARMVPCAPATTPPSTPAPLPSEARLAASMEPEVTPPLVTSADSRACFQMDASLPLVRLKQRVEPVFSPQVLNYLQNSEAKVVVQNPDRRKRQC